MTRDVTPEALDDLRARPSRAAVTFVDRDAIEILPAKARCSGETYQFAVRTGAIADLAQREVVLVIDDGPYWFQLRGISVRGLALPLANQDADGLSWYAIEPRRTLAWNYGALREE
ncbi:MAG: hypothetical protein HY270_07835 [Deltaproteobacteria bacterium]|nr:hypothetical protein [Deltaproteobacteria bacterium]